MKDLVIEKQQKAEMMSATRAFLAEELDVAIGALQAEMLVERLGEILGPFFYNQGLLDAHAAILRRMEDAACDGWKMQQPISTCWNGIRRAGNGPQTPKTSLLLIIVTPLSRMVAMAFRMPSGSMPRLASSMKRTFTSGNISSASSTEKLTQ